MSEIEQKVLIVIELFENGMPLKNSIEEAGITRSGFFKAIRLTPQLNLAYASAQMAHGEILVEEIIEIADHDEDAARARNKIDARKWYASKIIPKKYGDRIDLNIVATVDIKQALVDARQRAILPASYQVKEPCVEIVDNTEQSTQSATGGVSVEEDADKNESVTMEDILE